MANSVQIHLELRQRVPCLYSSLRWKHIGRQSIAFFYGLPTSIRFSEGYVNYGTPNMNRLLWLVCGIALLMTPYALRAQRRGGHGEGTGRAPVGSSSTD